MAIRAAPGDLLQVDRELEILSSHVQREKERVSSNFQQLHTLLAVKEHSLLQEMDNILFRVRQEFAEKRETLKELNTARESLERDLTKNKLRDVLEKNLRVLEDKIREEFSREMSVGWLELDWEKEQLEQSVIEVCKVVIVKKRPFRSEDYSLKLRPVWFCEGRGPGKFECPMQIAIDGTTQNIFVVDATANIIQVFNDNGKYLYSIPTLQSPNGIALTNEFIFVTTKEHLVKLKKSNNKLVKSVITENGVWGIDSDINSNIYGCENWGKSVIVFDSNLKSLNRIDLKSPQFKSNTQTHSIKLYENSMYIMFGGYPPFHLQIFSLEGELVRCLIPESEIGRSYLFSIDQLGNIIVADWSRNQIKIFSDQGEAIHTISGDMLSEDDKFNCPNGVAIDKNNRIIVAQTNKKCYLLAF